MPTNQPTTLPDWYPAWARELADLYFSGTTCLFILHGNVRDLVAAGEGEGVAYVGLTDFLATQVFGAWDVVVQYDLGTGLKPRAGSDAHRLQTMMQHLAGQWGDPGTWPRDADNALLRLDRLLERNLLEEDAARRKSIGVLLDYAQHLVPAGDWAALGRASGANVVRLLGWARNPYFKRVNTGCICLITDKLAEVNDRLVQSPHVATIEIPMPDTAARRRFIEAGPASEDQAGPAAADATALAEISNGLSLVSLDVMLARARRAPDSRCRRRGSARSRKAMIERQCQGLLEFVEPSCTLDLVVGHVAAKRRLRADAELLLSGRLDAAPMGYLISGPVGTGKTFLAECYAGSIGIPCVKLRNFRSKYVGETEGNLEQVLTVLRSLGPVVVIIDEADAGFGQPIGGGRLGHVEPRILDARQPDGRHALSRAHRVDAADVPARICCRST